MDTCMAHVQTAAVCINTDTDPPEKRPKSRKCFSQATLVLALNVLSCSFAFTFNFSLNLSLNFVVIYTHCLL